MMLSTSGEVKFVNVAEVCYIQGTSGLIFELTAQLEAIVTLWQPATTSKKNSRREKLLMPSPWHWVKLLSWKLRPGCLQLTQAETSARQTSPQQIAECVLA
jgi:hypothetical protein